MFVKQVEIHNVRAIQKFKMKFGRCAGWHVVIGDNGAGKSTIIKSIALALVGPREAMALRQDWKNWLSRSSDFGSIGLELEQHVEDESHGEFKEKNLISCGLSFERLKSRVELFSNTSEKWSTQELVWGDNAGWFSVAYGPFRRFEGGNQSWGEIYASYPRLGAHLSVFGEDVALTEVVDWLVRLNYQRLEKKEEGDILGDIRKLVNSPDFLPHGAILDEISSEGVFFKDGNGTAILMNELSDGYRSVLSMTFELLRQLIRVFGPERVFQKVREGKMIVDVPGVVLIDEVDAHLHPTWQTRIGDWFTSYFPQIQFIVSSHSPLVCRASTKGTIWRLAAPGTKRKSGQVKGVEKDKLLYGNVLDAFGTDLFGQALTVSSSGNKKLKRLGELNIKSMLGDVSDREQTELDSLKKIFPTEKTELK